MSFNDVPPGKGLPNEINVVIEIPAEGGPVKYEVDKESGVIFVDRFMTTTMRYPCNYGYVPQTLSEDGDPVDVLVLTPAPLLAGTVVTARPVGVLKMTDEAGGDHKIIAVPIDKLCKSYREALTIDDMQSMLLDQISHFFEHYKDLDEGKWVRVEGWGNIDDAKEEIMSSVAMYKDAPVKPNF